jgi:S-adenosylmethionine/arginine decarboxylase-like enzyme
MKTWGKEVIVDAFDCDAFKIRSEDNIKTFLKELVKRIDMVAYGEPQVIHFGYEDKKGFTGVQLLETSNIVCHFSEDTNNAYFNVFSCKDFDEQTVLDTILEYFNAYRTTSTVVLRG